MAEMDKRTFCYTSFDCWKKGIDCGQCLLYWKEKKICMRYGLPYKGSKNLIVEKIVDFLPQAGSFYDLFAGGCSITHCAMLSDKWQNYIINDIEPGIVQLFKDAVNGRYRNENRWVSRDMFYLLKDSDPYIRYCWSFGNNGRDYIYSRDIEPYKKAIHEMLFEPDVFERKRKYRQVIKELAEYMKRTQRELDGKNENFCGLQSLESLESLERLERLESLERLEIYSQSYDTIDIKPDSIIYSDIPYRNTNAYSTEFNHEAFYDWVCQQDVPVFISEYWMPEDRFTCVLEINKRSTLCATANNAVLEKIFIPKKN